VRTTLTVIALAILLAANPAAAQATYTVDTAHSNVGFSIRHLVSTVSGEFTEFSGTITEDFANLDNSHVEFVIETASIDTRNDKRDGHLRSADFFDAENHPEITFSSTKITKKDADSFVVAGALNIRGVERQVLLNVDYLGEMQAMGGTRAGYKISTTLNRQDFGVAWNRTLEQGTLLLGDEVEVSINLEVVKNEPKSEGF
jgi:polyisoprenoid-binding protein YceI